METDPRIDEARRRLEVLNHARAYADLIESAGWKLIYHQQIVWLEELRADMRKPSSDVEMLALTRRWQAAEDLIELQATTINNTLAEAEDIRGSLHMDEALLMETLGHEQSEPTGTGSDRTGH